MNERLFHLVLPDQLEASRAHGETTWRPPSLATEGFVHLSFAAQLAGTLEVHYAGRESVWLLEVELEDARARSAPGGGGPLVVEPSRGGALFPHLYRPLAWAEVARAWLLRRAPNASWGLPNLGTTPALDRPAGEPLPPGKPGAGRA